MAHVCPDTSSDPIAGMRLKELFLALPSPDAVQIFKYGDRTLYPDDLFDVTSVDELSQLDGTYVRPQISITLCLDDEPTDIKPEVDPSGTSNVESAANRTEDTKARDLHAEAYTTYATANASYQQSPGHQFPYITINSGRRSVHEQARLYEAYLRYLVLGGAPANPANKPGQSKHEYGLAIDVVRGNDESRLSNALAAAGWTATVPDEGWHFEATSIPSWASIESAIQTTVTPLSDQYASFLSDHFHITKRHQDDMPHYVSEKNRVAQLERSIRAEEAALRLRAAELQRRDAYLRTELGSMQLEQQQINELVRRYNTMIFDRCPNGNTFEQCTHDDLKRQWLIEKNNLAQTISSRSAALNARKSSYEQGRIEYGSDLSQFRQDKLVYDRRAQDLIRQNNQLAQEKGRLDRMLDRARQKRLDATTKLADVAAAVRRI